MEETNSIESSRAYSGERSKSAVEGDAMKSPQADVLVVGSEDAPGGAVR